MERLGTRTLMHRCTCAAVLTFLAVVIASSSLGLAQGSGDRAIDQAQRAVRERITSREGGRDLIVRFASDARTESASNAQVRVRGTGSLLRSNDGKSRTFSYEAVVNTRNVSDIQYDWRGDWFSSGSRSSATNRLTGTYRLDQGRSDDPATTADRVTANLPRGQQERLRNAVMRRLEAPESLAIERDGRTMTIASSHAEPVTFEADGREQIEQSRNGRQMRTTATLSGERLTVSTEGDRSVDYQVTFEPIDSGRSLRVTRRITDEGLRQAVVAKSVYDKTSDSPRFNVRDNYRAAGASRGSVLVPDGTQLVAVLNENLSTKQSRDGDRFTLTVRSPSRYEGATIDGHLAGVARSGQVSGRAEMSFEFDTIRQRQGRVYDFAGSIESVRTTNDDTVRVDNEGQVQDESGQTGRTVTRTGIGAAIGAVIGAVAGGGKGAAIGAAVGAGVGAGSVFIQGRNDLDLMSGTEFTIRVSAPR
jgi:YmgG-like glycine-zipper protein